MKVGSRNARLSAAVMAALCSASPLYADNLIWNPGQSTTGGTDGQGLWDNSSANWYDSTTSTGPVVFNADAAAPDSVTFGTTPTLTGTNQSSLGVLLTSNITANNITFNGAQTSSTTYAPYAIADEQDGNETLTLGGNLTKAATNGVVVLQLTNQIQLTAGTHTVSIADTPGDAPELTVSAGFSGPGSLVLDNSTASEGGSYGTFVLQGDSSYTGGTAINDGRVVIATAAGLGTGAVSIGSLGTVSIGGVSNTFTGSSKTIANAFTITRNTYTGANYGNYPDAILANNTNQATNVYSFTGPITIDSTDARIGAFTSTINITQPFVQGPTVGAGNAVADLDGDYSGFITLSADNTAYGAAGNAIKIINGVEVNVNSDAELGGVGSNLILAGGTIHPTGALGAAGSAFMTNFGGHTIVGGTVSTGVDLDTGEVFTVNGLTGGGVGDRGTGTLNYQGTNTFTGTPYYDGGTVNFQAGSVTTQPGLRLRSPVVNIAGTLNVGGTYSSLGADTTGSPGGTPDKATVNITSGGQLVESTGDDFNISDNANTQGTINMSGTAVLTLGGNVFIGKSSGAVGTVNESGGTFTAKGGQVFIGQNNSTGSLNQTGGSFVGTHAGNFGFVIGDGRNRVAANAGTVSGTYNLSGAGSTFSETGEIYVGEGANGNGVWNQSAGTATFSSWFVEGREGGSGLVNLSGTASLTKTGTVGADSGSNISIGEGGNTHVNVVNISGSASFTENDGEFYIGNNNSTGTVNVGTAADLTSASAAAADAGASLTVNNWFAVGRAGASTGTLNIYDGTVTKANGNYLDIAGDGGTSTGTVNVMGGTLNSNATIIGENGAVNGFLNVSGGNVNLTSQTSMAQGNTATGTINLTGGTLTAAGFIANSGGGTGKATINFNGGTLAAYSANTNFIGAKVGSVDSTGGARINPNGFAITINSALKHDTTITGADGGLNVTGAGTVTMTGANSYTGLTTVKTASLVLNTAAQSPVLTGGGADIQSGKVVFDYNGGTDPIAQVQSLLTSSYASNFATGQIHSSTEVAGKLGLGYADNTTTGQVTVMYTLFGDANLDGKVDASDFVLLSNNFGNSGTTWSQGNFNYDGSTSAADFVLLSNNFGSSLTGLGVTALNSSELATYNAEATDLGFSAAQIVKWDAVVTATPEPASFLLAGIGAMSLLRRRVRRNGSAVTSGN